MTVYLFFFFILFLLSLKGINKFLMLIIIIALSIVLGFRANQIGVDTNNYIDYYNSLSLDIFSGYMEKGWNFIAVTCKCLGLSAYGFNFVVAILSLFPFYYVASTNKDNHINGYIIYFLYSLGFYFLMFNGMRQFLAISILLLGYSCLAKGESRKFFVYVSLASLVHLSSLCAILMYFVGKIRLTSRRVAFVLLTTYILGLIANEFFFSAIAGKYIANVEEFGLRSGLLYALTVGLLTNLFFFWLYKCQPSLANNLWIKYNLFSIMMMNIMSNLIIGPRIVYIFSITSIVALSLYASLKSVNNVIKPVIYLYSFVVFLRFLVPELLTVGLDGCLIPYEINLQIVAD